MTLIIKKPTGAKLVMRKTWQPMDPDAAAYIANVEAADAAAGSLGGLEEKTKIAIDNFVLGCKADGIWNAIKASCILAGARTLAGALVPLVGVAPTNVGPFVAGDYNRKTGLVGDGSTKYLNSNRNNNLEPRDSQHLSVYVSSANSQDANRGYIGCGLADVGASHIFSEPGTRVGIRSRSSTATGTGSPAAIGFIAKSRGNGTSVSTRISGATASLSSISETPLSQTIVVFGRNQAAQANARLSFYSIGESLDLALLDARVTELMNTFAAVLP